MREPNIVVIGSLNMDIAVEAERSPSIGETVMGTDVHFIPGGKGANQAVATSRLGAHTTMIGTLGSDDFGAELRNSLVNSGVDVLGIKTAEGIPTGIASILLAQKDNQIVVVPGANAHCLPEDVYRHEALLAQADVVLLQLEIPLETVVAAAEVAKRHGKTVILNPGPARDLPEELLKHTDYITPNRLELALLTGMDTSGEQWKDAAKRLLEMGPRHVITTLGSQGSAYIKPDMHITTVPAYRVPVIDTTGAGDSFNGGLAYALAVGDDLDAAVRFAAKVSALAVTKLGAQAGMPSLEEVETFCWSNVQG
ncbi:ribokinase [Paenibacillus chitinolyticus]|uniref:Ribokinase n=1 Tax=Paenibacillus chitinolyticus TaxID=79263 RepID=A0A410WR31_9BACL|nr:ribokinase [Paenibacillus chitinolyticus]MCY9591586.1 ribokinase [Paenibacillus chitinolyticus]MCY9594581.1 ribokinase [Paenibacillus chitinolyticus]QAV16825.1 ribokinase [Paenibacillus chitinolyticus]